MIWFANEQVMRGFAAMFETCSLAAKGVMIGGVKRSSLHVSMFARIFFWEHAVRTISSD